MNYTAEYALSPTGISKSLLFIEETLKKNFDCIPEEFEDWYLYDFENKGLVYTYILHHIMNPPKKIKEVV